ncbi:NAD(P)/FAD-dependent oxidoreductase [bacterium]|nr:MAG: NAD(P)/FAD-dependent oxidoreductase [bacterium]
MQHNKYNLAVIGGGPAGMIAAGHAGEFGSHVVLLEKNDRLGVKLLMTGKGRCNITNSEEDIKKFIDVYGKNGRFLHSALNKFSNKDVIDFFEKHGVKTKAERGNRVFPVSDMSKDVLDCLKRYLSDNDVEIKLSSPIVEIVTNTKTASDDKMTISKIILKNGEEICADNFIIATGGKSYPRTGSNGNGYEWLKQLGHTVVEPKPALTPILIKEKFIKRLEGLSLKNVEISLWDDTHKIDSRFGEALFTGDGLSGPIILDLSRTIGGDSNPPSPPYGRLWRAKIDFKPALDYPTLDKRIQRDFDEQKNKQFKNSLDKLLPQTLIPVIIELSGIEPEKQVNEVTKIERKKLIKLLKEFELTVDGLVGFEKAIITSGGVNLKEVDSKTMQSKIVDNLYFAGEILDVDGPTGGYNLQVAWSTGYLAGGCVKV